MAPRAEKPSEDCSAAERNATGAHLCAADAGAIARGAAILRAGGLVAFPTETVYGLGADATSDSAVARIFEAKGRPRFNPLIAHVLDPAMAAPLVEISHQAQALMDAFWPGPLTLVLPRRADGPLSLLACAGLETAAVRAPAHSLARALIEDAGRPLAAPSANPSGRVSPTAASHVAQGLGDRVDLILDGGSCEIGLESTVVSLAGEAPALLRPGGLERAAIEAVLGPLARPARSAAPSAPGMLASHYAPKAKMRLNARAARPGEVFLGFGDLASEGPNALNLSASGNLREAAANLFAYLRKLDANDARAIAVAPIPIEGLGEAINDRLMRAAAPRDQ